MATTNVPVTTIETNNHSRRLINLDTAFVPSASCRIQAVVAVPAKREADVDVGIVPPKVNVVPLKLTPGVVATAALMDSSTFVV